MSKTFTYPPQEIYDVLHEAEVRGIEIPESVQNWWEIETELKTEAEERYNRVMD